MDDITLLEDLVDLEMTYNEVEDIVKEKTSDYTIPRGELEFDSLNGAKLALKILEPHYEVEYRELQNNGEDHQATYKVKFMRKGVRTTHTTSAREEVNKKESYMKVRKLNESTIIAPASFSVNVDSWGATSYQFWFSDGRFKLAKHEESYSGSSDQDVTKDPKAIKDALPYAEAYLNNVQEMVAKMKQLAGK